MPQITQGALPVVRPAEREHSGIEADRAITAVVHAQVYPGGAALRLECGLELDRAHARRADLEVALRQGPSSCCVRLRHAQPDGIELGATRPFVGEDGDGAGH